MTSHSTKHLPSILLALLCLFVSAQAPPSAIDLHERQLTTVTTTPTTTISFSTPQSTNCPVPCGYYAQLCCNADQICTTDANNQAQCGPSPSNSPTCPAYSTSTYTSIQSLLSTTSYVITYTRIQTDIQTIIGTVTWQILPQVSDCCNPLPPDQCRYAYGETPCGEICCSSGQYCARAGECVAVGGGESTDSGMWQIITTTYVQSDLQTVTEIYSTFVIGGGSISTAVAPARPTSETVTTVATVTQTG